MARMRLNVGKWLLAVAAGLAASTSQAQVKINQLWGGGNVANGIYTVDYVELVNTGSAPVDMTGWSLQTSSQTTATSTWHRIDLAGTIQPGQFFLVQPHALQANAVGIPIPAPDAASTSTSPTLNISSSFGAAAIVRNQTTLANGCPLPNSNFEDYVHYADPTAASALLCIENVANGVAPGDFQRAVYRKDGGCTDTNNNGADLELGPANPRNSSVNSWVSSTFAPNRIVSSVGGNATLTVSKATIACNGLGTLTSASADLSQFGGPSSQALTPNGSGGFTLTVPVPTGLPANSYSIPISTTDGTLSISTRAFLTITDTPPANDDCASAIDLTTAGGFFAGSIDNRGAGPDLPSGACADGIPSTAGVWFRYVPAQNEIITLTETGTQNIKYGVFIGGCGSPTSVACSNSEGTEANPQARFRLNAGTQYHILVAHEPGYQPTLGMDLNFSTTPAPAAPSNDSCAAATPITFPFVASVNAEGALDDSNVPVCATFAPTGARHGTWYSFSVPGPGRFQFIENNANHSPSYAIYSGSCGSLTEVGCGTTTSNVNIAAAGNYRMLVYMNNNGLAPNGTFDFDIRYHPDPTNDVCTTAQDLSSSTFPLQITQSILSAGDDLDIGCNSGTTTFGRAVWFKYTAATAGTFSISNANQVSGFTIAYAWYDFCNGAEMGCGGGSSTTTRFIPLTQNQTIYIAVGEWLRTSSERTDPIIVDFNFSPAATNISCQTAEDLNVTGLPVNRSYDQTNAVDLPTPNTCSTGAFARKAVWFKYTASTSGRLRLNELQSTQNGDFRVFTAGASPDCDNLQDYACISDALDRGSFTIAAGTTYYIAVNDGGTSATGPAPYILTFELATSPLPSDLCSAAEVIPALPFTASISNVKDFGDDADISCNNANSAVSYHGVWFSYVAPQNMAITISETSSTATVAAMYTSCGGSEVACRSAEDHYFELSAGQQYYFMVAYDSSSSALGPTATNAFEIRAFQVDMFTNDTCDSAKVVSSTNFTARVNLEQATPDAPAANITGCNVTTATQMRNTAWYKLVVTGTGDLTGMINPDFGTLVDGMFAVYGSTDGTCANIISSPLQCDTDPEPLMVGSGTNPQLTLLAGNTYFLQVGKATISTTTLAGVSDIQLAFSGTLGGGCPADFNGVGGLTVQDIFDFLNAWFAGLPSADFNGGGLAVSDIFDFLNAWFAGC